MTDLKRHLENWFVVIAHYKRVMEDPEMLEDELDDVRNDMESDVMDVQYKSNWGHKSVLETPTDVRLLLDFGGPNVWLTAKLSLGRFTYDCKLECYEDGGAPVYLDDTDETLSWFAQYFVE